MKKLELKYNQTLIFYIKVLKETKLISDWKTGAEIYFNMEGQEITVDALSAQAKKLKVENINQQTLFKHLANNKQNIPKDQKVKAEELDEKEQKRKKLSESTIINTIKIPEKDYPLFGVDLEVMDVIEIEKKIQAKMGDEAFILDYIGWNPGIWQIEKYNPGCWTVNMKLKKDDGTEEPHIELNTKTNLVLKKRAKQYPYVSKKDMEEVLEETFKKGGFTPFDLFKENQNHTETIPLSENLLLVCPGLELHIGKLGSKSDFEDYSTNHALARIKLVAQEIINYQEKVGASKMLLGIGNDYFNTDSVDDKTTAGTPQTNDTRHKELYIKGKVGMLRLIETCKPYFDKVIVKGNPGNHDEKTSFSLFSNIYDLYNWTKDPKVEVTMTMKDMWFTTHYIHGDNLIVLTHGKSGEGKPMNNKQLAEKIPEYFPEEYRKCKNVYIHAAHLHHDQERFETIKRVHVMRHAALSGVDAWHANSGYVGPRQGHTIYLYDKEKGLKGQWLITLSDEEKQMKAKPAASTTEDYQKAVEKVLNLTPESVEAGITEHKIKDLTSSIDSIRNKYSNRAKAVTNLLGKDYSELKNTEIENVMDAIGYNEAVAPYTAKMDNIVKYKHKTKKAT